MALIITLTLHDFFLESTRPSAKVHAWAYAGIGLNLASTLLLLSTLESADRVRLRAQVGDEYRAYRKRAGMFPVLGLTPPV